MSICERRESKEKPLLRKVALVTGSSRGIGEGIALALAEVGADIIVNFREKRPRAEEVRGKIESLGQEAYLVQGDITFDEGIDALLEKVRELGGLDILVLSAAGGLEKEENEDSARKKNVISQLEIVDKILPFIRPGGVIIYPTSHPAHLYGQEGGEFLKEYEIVAKTKNECEKRLLERLAKFEERGIKLLIFSGPLTKETSAYTLFRKRYRHNKEMWEKLDAESIYSRQWGKRIAEVLSGNFVSGQVVLVG